MPKTVAEVLLDQGLERPLDYTIPSEFPHLREGMRVEVPLRNRSAKGTIVALKHSSAFSSVKDLIRPLSEAPLISDELFQLADWISKYYCSPLQKVIKTLLPPSLREKGSHKMQKFVKPLLSLKQLRELCMEKREKHPAQAKVLELLLHTPKGLFMSELLELGSISESPVRTLAKKEVVSVREVKVDRSPIFDHDFFPTKAKVLTNEQQLSLDTIEQNLNQFETHLLHGVTGSGKTEIYLQAIDRVLALGKGVIYLVPEISLTAQTIERFKGRFGNEQIAILHHRLSNGERFDAWHNIREGKAKIVIGARSAIFCPVKDLGMIIVDEEHESSYKQAEEAPKYHARDVAVVRGKFANCPVILGSATPSLESYNNALKGKYTLHILKNRADSAASLPTVNIVDMQREFERNGGFTLFSDPLLSGIKERLSKGEQILLFLNRRGYHTSAMCQKCSYVVCCPHCDLSLTYHLGSKILSCHLCDHRLPPPRSCPECSADGPLKFKGAGTEMLERSLHALFPEVRTLRLDADTTRHKGSHEQIFKQFRSGKADVLIGTQMIAKGLHFPLVTLVGVIGLDGSLNIPDFRASEQVFQLLTQVAGRSGRGELAGEVIIQTHLPDHSTIKLAANQDFEAFYAEEIALRKMFTYPPFTHLVKFSFSGVDEGEVQSRAESFRSGLIRILPPGVEILPVVACGYAKIKGKYRFQCLVKTEKVQSVLPQVESMRKEFGKKRGINLSVDVDPLSTFF